MAHTSLRRASFSLTCISHKVCKHVANDWDPFTSYGLAQALYKVWASCWYHCRHKTHLNTDAINYGAPCNTRKRQFIRANRSSNISCSLQSLIRSQYSLSDVCNLMVVLIAQTKLCSVKTNAQCIRAMLVYFQTGKIQTRCNVAACAIVNQIANWFVTLLQDSGLYMLAQWHSLTCCKTCALN